MKFWMYPDEKNKKSIEIKYSLVQNPEALSRIQG